MLRSFRLGNHRSIWDEQELLLLPAYDKRRAVLPVVAIYGANAAGKSNFLDGLQFMVRAVTESFDGWQPLDGVPRRPFRLDPRAAEEASTFVVELLLGGIRYTYGFQVDNEMVVEEWLFSYPEKRRRIVFERRGEELRFGSTVPTQRGKTEVLEDLLRPNALFLSLAAKANLDPLLPVYEWFLRGVSFRGPGRAQSTEYTAVKFIDGSPQRQRLLVELLQLADLGITDVLVLREEDPTWREMGWRVEQELAMLQDRRDAGGQNEFQQSLFEDLEQQLRARARMYSRPRYRRRLLFAHGPGALFDLGEESKGTQGWLSLLPVALTCLEEGSTLVVDEIDSSLHPRLTARLVALFRDQVTNPKGAQLLFNTHDTSLLSPVLGEEVLKRDEVWFVEKNDSGASVLFPLTEFKPRAGENAERRYLGGSYGAIPNILAEDFVEAVRSSGLFGGADGQA